MTQVIVATHKHDCTNLLGKYLDESHYDTLIEDDVDFYKVGALDGDNSELSESECIFKFRKNVFSPREQL